ncbi:MAG: GNAT family N-acetyltransferase [Oligoflexia bacterium]|nr:GNAT family N-acetyltransferase [Oligoflexia bacterium]MBF0364756.1 GNAT family N-acetyltransferase [Oligoflexia bacterium]
MKKIDSADDFYFSSLSRNPEYRQEVITAIETAFGYSKEHHFEIDFFPLMCKENSANNILLLSKSTHELIGHIGIKFRKLKFDDFETKVALIGGVFIAPQYQGQGYFGKFFTYVLKSYSTDVSMFWLWSDHYELYKKYGFDLSGGQLEIKKIDFVGTISHEIDIVEKKLLQISDKEWQEIKQIYCDVTIKQNAAFLREQDNWEELTQITSTTAYIFYKEKHIIGYCFYNKGMDLRNVIHELAFAVNIDSKIKKTILTMLVPKHTLWLPEESDFADGELKYLALIKIGNREKFKKFVTDWSRQQINITMITHDMVNFYFNHQHYQEDIASFKQLLFGPNPCPSWHSFTKGLAISGMDSV